jgi:cytochrome P450
VLTIRNRFTANVIPATFWFLFEILAADTLLDRVRKELQDATTPSGTYDPSKVSNQPLLRSIYAEVLRLHVASLVTRSAKQAHSLDGWVIPKDQYLFVSSHLEHRQSYWNAVDEHENHHGPNDFWAERFLVEKGGETKFSVEGKQGRWMPYGMGEHMCPGRHFAKYEMLLSFAVLVTAFDIELLSPAGWCPDDNLARYGYGAQTPKQEVRFRIRRRK